MGLSTVLKAKSREVKTSNYASRLRADGLLPAVFYGPGMKTLNICLDYADFKTAITTSEGNRSLYTLEIESQGSVPALLKDYQVDPLSRKIIHADFYRLDSDKPVIVKVPIVLTGKPIGVEKGGQLQTGAREVQIATLPEKAPAELTVDISSLALGQSLHLSQIITPEGTKLACAVDLAVATVATPKGVKAELEGAEGTAAK